MPSFQIPPQPNSKESARDTQEHWRSERSGVLGALRTTQDPVEPPPKSGASGAPGDLAESLPGIATELDQIQKQVAQ